MSSMINNINELRLSEPFVGLTGRVLQGQYQTIVFWSLKAGTELPEHHHVNEQIAIIQKGEMWITIGGDTMKLQVGMVARIPSNVPHSAVAISDCLITDIFQPARTDL